MKTNLFDKLVQLGVQESEASELISDVVQSTKESLGTTFMIELVFSDDTKELINYAWYDLDSVSKNIKKIIRESTNKPTEKGKIYLELEDSSMGNLDIRANWIEQNKTIVSVNLRVIKSI